MFLKKKVRYKLCANLYIFWFSVVRPVSLYIFFYGKGVNFVYDSPCVLRAKDTGEGEDQPFAWKRDTACLGT